MVRRKWRKRAKRKTILLGLVGMIMLSGCSTVRETMAQLQIYGSNELIAQDGDSYSYRSREGAADPEGAVLDFRQFSGKQTLWTVNAAEASRVTLDLEMGIDNGKCKLVHVRPDGEVVKLADSSAAGGTLTLDLPEGENVIKLVGKKAYGSLKAEFGDSGTARISTADGKLTLSE
ncbi:hypothetical protein [Saccharibacillus alkalitolerans]|uniref:Adhesin domain-containing protein n=1 Tax=Saccharibacillus alkalitolerans TaxID=2705290 RepID=A0ABX0FAQ6_9BACL|nr:hypothetical protein [Saccharibacillus alkalitolerans]NGZ78016.1 hypothetical protein [Saccharibacillus alkalitolerans]